MKEENRWFCLHTMTPCRMTVMFRHDQWTSVFLWRHHNMCLAQYQIIIIHLFLKFLDFVTHMLVLMLWAFLLPKTWLISKWNRLSVRRLEIRQHRQHVWSRLWRWLTRKVWKGENVRYTIKIKGRSLKKGKQKEHRMTSLKRSLSPSYTIQRLPCQVDCRTMSQLT